VVVGGFSRCPGRWSLSCGYACIFCGTARRVQLEPIIQSLVALIVFSCILCDQFEEFSPQTLFMVRSVQMNEL